MQDSNMNANPDIPLKATVSLHSQIETQMGASDEMQVRLSGRGRLRMLPKSLGFAWLRSDQEIELHYQRWG